MKPEPQLPTDPQALRALVMELLAALSEKDRRIGQLSSQLEVLKRRLFGRRSERLDSNQLVLELGAWLASQPAPPEAPAVLDRGRVLVTAGVDPWSAPLAGRLRRGTAMPDARRPG